MEASASWNFDCQPKEWPSLKSDKVGFSKTKQGFAQAKAENKQSCAIQEWGPAFLYNIRGNWKRAKLSGDG